MELLDIIIVSIMEYENSRLHDLKKKQMKGIKKAVEKKQDGNGKYGRPKVKLPADFEAELKSCIAENKPLETYRDKIGMKKSTFYKYANSLTRKDEFIE